MPNPRKFHSTYLALAGAYLALAGLLTTAGCGSKGAPSEAQTAAINGTSVDSAGSGGSAREAKPAKPLPNPVVCIQTTLGEIVVELDAKAAPATTEEFLHYVKAKHYDGTIFHQVIQGQVAAIVGGQYARDLTARPPRTPIPNEAARCGLHNDRYSIAMMRDPRVRDSATCQFFINVNDNPVLDHKGNKDEEFGYCPFGKVVTGMDVVQKIAQVQVKDLVKDGRSFEQMPVDQIVVNQITIR